MGIAGAGNSGTALAALFAPGLAAAFGWVNVFGIVLIPLTIVLIAFIFMAKDAPDAPPPKTFAEYLKVLKDKDAWWFMFFYSVTFGGFVGLASSLVIYFNTQYGLDPKMAGFFTAGCVFAGSLVRPIGGNVADRIGGVKSLSVMYVFAAIFLPSSASACRKPGWRWLPSSAPCSPSVWVTVPCSSWCRSASARKSAS
jgi:NNP family nitrate/nitrite transporter-like MFS transporter